MKQWEKEMKNAYIKASNHLSYDITGFYIQLKNIAEKYLKTGEMQEGDSFRFFLSTGVSLEYKFYEKSSELIRYDTDGNINDKHTIHYDDTAELEYAQLKELGLGLKAEKACIGQPYPVELYNLVKNIKKGQVLSFVDGNSYICLSNKGGVLKLSTVFEGDPSNFNLKNLSKREVITVNLDDYSIRRFYTENKKYATERLEYNVGIMDTAELAIKNIEENLQRNKLVSYHFGNFNLFAKKNMLTNSTSWYDNSGHKIDRADVITSFALLSNKLRKREYMWKDEKDSHLFEDAEMERKLESLQKEQKYADMYEEMKSYVTKNKQSLSIHTHYFDRSNDGFIPKTIVFAEKDGIIKTFAMYYKDNNFQNGYDPDRVQDIDKTEFVSICDYLYTEQFGLIRTAEEERLCMEQVKQGREITPVRKKIIDNAADAVAYNKAGVVFGSTSYTEKDIQLLAEQFFTNKNDMSVADINKALDEKGEYDE